MSAEEEETIVPITEWPVTASVSETKTLNAHHSFIQNASRSNDLAQNAYLRSQTRIVKNKLQSSSRFQPYGPNYEQNKPKGENSQDRFQSPGGIDSRQCLSSCRGFSDNKSKADCIIASTFDSRNITSPEDETDIDVKIAKWWRKYKAFKCPDSFPKGCNANTTLHHITRLPDCHRFLLGERERLLRKTELNFKSSAKIYAALAGVEDRLGKYFAGLQNIENALQIDQNNTEYLWMREKLKRQCQVEDEQTKTKKLLENAERILSPFTQVQRVSGVDLSISEFQEKFVKNNKPVILTDVVPAMIKRPFDFSLVKSVAGNKSVRVKKAVENSIEWARLEDGNLKTVSQFVEEVQSNSTSEYLFDWSLPLHCPELAHELSLPDYFKDNLLLVTSPDSLYRDSWPSLFVAPKGAISNLHVDAFASHFWMALFQGEKRWTFFDPKDTPLLYPKYFHSLDPVFQVDMANPDMETFPLLCLARPQQCVLQPGELLFVPARSPHFVENLTASLAVSSNYVNESNFHRVCEELRVNALMDPRGRDLLEQFEKPEFRTHMKQNQEKLIDDHKV